MITPDSKFPKYTNMNQVSLIEKNKEINDSYDHISNHNLSPITRKTNDSDKHNQEISLDENGKFKSIICPVCNIMPTQHRYFFEVKNGFYYEGRNVCARAFCAECGSKWGCEMGA